MENACVGTVGLCQACLFVFMHAAHFQVVCTSWTFTAPPPLLLFLLALVLLHPQPVLLPLCGGEVVRLSAGRY